MFQRKFEEGDVRASFAQAPTISSLSSDKWFAIESIVDAKI